METIRVVWIDLSEPDFIYTYLQKDVEVSKVNVHVDILPMCNSWEKPQLHDTPQLSFASFRTLYIFLFLEHTQIIFARQLYF